MFSSQFSKSAVSFVVRFAPLEGGLRHKFPGQWVIARLDPKIDSDVALSAFRQAQVMALVSIEIIQTNVFNFDRLPQKLPVWIWMYERVQHRNLLASAAERLPGSPGDFSTMNCLSLGS